MIAPDGLKKTLCRTFCESVQVNPVPCGYAISAGFRDRSGDPIGFYLVETPEGFRIEDDGSYLAELIAQRIAINDGQRGRLLDAILAQAGAFWDRETYEIASESFSAKEIGERATQFLSALIRIRDLEYLTADVVRSTFREDALAELTEQFGSIAEFAEDEAVDFNLNDFPSDLVIRPKKDGRPKIGAVFFANTSAKLNEALLLQLMLEKLGRNDVKTIAIIEDSNLGRIGQRFYQREQNRSVSMPIYRGDERAAIAFVGRLLDLPVQIVH